MIFWQQRIGKSLQCVFIRYIPYFSEYFLPGNIIVSEFQLSWDSITHSHNMMCNMFWRVQPRDPQIITSNLRFSVIIWRSLDGISGHNHPKCSIYSLIVVLFQAILKFQYGFQQIVDHVSFRALAMPSCFASWIPIGHCHPGAWHMNDLHDYLFICMHSTFNL